MSSTSWNKADFLSDPLYTQKPPRNWLSWVFILASFVFLTVFFIWADASEVEEVTRGQGRIVPSSSIQVVQSLEGGIVDTIHISEGERVKKGQLLLNIDDTLFSASLEEVNAQAAALQGKISRLEAELAGRSRINFLNDFELSHPNIVSSEKKLFTVRRSSLSNEMNTLRARRDQRKQEYEELLNTQTRLEGEILLAEEEQQINQRVSDLIPEADKLELRKEISRLEGEVNVALTSQKRAQAAIREAESLINQARSTFREESQSQLTEARAELSVFTASTKSADDRVQRAGLKSPVDGIINALHVNTVGGVVRPGDSLVEIVPFGDTLQIEARIRPKDIAFLSPNQKARVTITAYDYSIYGGLQGYVERIGADSLTDEITGESYFPIDILADAANFKKDNETLPISPGMVASVDIITGKKTILQYLLKPVNKARYEGLRER